MDEPAPARPFDPHVTGDRGESAAAQMAIDRGWTVIDRNRRMRNGEADIVGVRTAAGCRQGLLVEVKTSKRLDEDLAARVTHDKRRRMFRMAAELVDEQEVDEVVVVIVCVHLSANTTALQWLEIDPF